MRLDYNNVFSLEFSREHEHARTIEREIECAPYQTLLQSSFTENTFRYSWNDTYTSVFDILTSDWYDIEDLKVTSKAQERINFWGQIRQDRETFTKIWPNSDEWFGYQAKTHGIFKGTNSIFINDGTGLGKTRSALSCLSNNYNMGPNLIICPKIAIDGWKSEIETVFPGTDYITIVGDAKERKLRLEHIEDVQFTIITYDLLIKHVGCRHWPTSKKLPEAELDGIQWNSVIADESHRIKNAKALRTRCAWRISDNAERRIALTATPITVDPQDLWAQLRFLAPDEFKSINKFREKFLRMEPSHHGGMDCLGWKEHGELHYLQLMGWRTTRRTFESPEVSAAMRHMTIPEEGPISVRSIPLTPMQKKAYKQMEDDLILSLQEWDATLIAKNYLDMFVKLRQISNGMPVTTEGGKVIGLSDKSSNKCMALKDLIDDADCNVVVFAEHSKVAGMIYRYLEDNLETDTIVRVITGDTRGPTRLAHIKEFQDEIWKNNLKISTPNNVLVCTTGTMSEAVSLTNAGLLIFAQEPASAQQMIQCRGRVRRIGSNVVVPVISLRSEGTVEETLAGRMNVKLQFLHDYLVKMKEQGSGLLITNKGE